MFARSCKRCITFTYCRCVECSHVVTSHSAAREPDVIITAERSSIVACVCGWGRMDVMWMPAKRVAACIEGQRPCHARHLTEHTAETQQISCGGRTPVHDACVIM